MVTVAVAGGTGKLGRAIVDVLVQEGKHQVLVLAREANPKTEEKIGATIVAVDYGNVEDLTKKLESNKIHTLISTVSTMAGPDPELNLIKAAENSATTKRFIPSSWGIKATPEMTEIFPLNKVKLAAKQALEKTSLEYTSFLNGYFLDYFLVPHTKSYMDPFSIVIDVENKTAAIPGSGDVPVVFTHTFDVARFVAAALELPRWEEESYVIGDKITWNQFLRFAEEARGAKFSVKYDSLEDLKAGKVSELPSHAALYPFFPKEALQGLLRSFGIMFEEGYLDFKPTQTLNEKFPEIKVKTIREQLIEAWQGK